MGSLARVVSLAVATLVAAAAAAWCAEPFTDAAGRTVLVREAAGRIFAAGPPAAVALHAVAPDLLAGWVAPLRPEAKAWLAAPFADLPVTGRLTGAGTAGPDAVTRAGAGLVVDIGTVDAGYAALADRVQAGSGVPVVLLDGALARTPELLATLGRLTGRHERAAELARASRAMLGEVEAALAVPPERRPRVYYARGADGLESGPAASITGEILTLAGGRNVVDLPGTGLVRVTVEQLVAWNPQVIVTLDPAIAGTLRADAALAEVAAVRSGRVLVAPALPFGWIDAPPGINRLIGLVWLAQALHPEIVRRDLRAAARDFYRLFYAVDLDEARLDRLLGG